MEGIDACVDLDSREALSFPQHSLLSRYERNQIDIVVVGSISSLFLEGCMSSEPAIIFASDTAFRCGSSLIDQGAITSSSFQVLRCFSTNNPRERRAQQAAQISQPPGLTLASRVSMSVQHYLGTLFQPQPPTFEDSWKAVISSWGPSQ